MHKEENDLIVYLLYYYCIDCCTLVLYVLPRTKTDQYKSGFKMLQNVLGYSDASEQMFCHILRDLFHLTLHKVNIKYQITQVQGMKQGMLED